MVSTLIESIQAGLIECCGLHYKPEPLILNEPTVHLDPLMESKVLSIIKELIKENKITVLYTPIKLERQIKYVIRSCF